MQARLAEDRRAAAERDRVSHVGEHLVRLPGQLVRLGEAPGRQRERRRGLHEVQSGERPGEPFHAAFEVGEFTPDVPQLTGLKQGVDPPQPTPQLEPGAARGVSGLEHPAGQHGPFGDSVGGAARQLPGPERVHQRDRVPRRSGRGQRVPADLSGPVVLAAVHQRLRVPRGDPGPQTIRKIVPGQGLLADAADLPVPFRYAAGLHHQRRTGQQAPVTPALGPPADSGRRLLRSGQVAAAVQGLGQGELKPGAVVLADLPFADRQRLAVQAHRFLERQRLRRHLGGRLTRRYRIGPVTGQRRLDPVPGDLSQVQLQLPLVQSLDRVRRGGVQPPLLRGVQPSGHG